MKHFLEIQRLTPLDVNRSHLTVTENSRPILELTEDEAVRFAEGLRIIALSQAVKATVTPETRGRGAGLSFVSLPKRPQRRRRA